MLDSAIDDMVGVRSDIDIGAEMESLEGDLWDRREATVLEVGVLWSHCETRPFGVPRRDAGGVVGGVKGALRLDTRVGRTGIAGAGGFSLSTGGKVNVIDRCSATTWFGGVFGGVCMVLEGTVSV